MTLPFLVLVWLALVAACFCLRAAFLRRQKTLSSGWRAMVNTLPLTLLFSPTILVAGWSGIPAPATLVLLGCALIPEARKDLARQNVPPAIIGFIGFWIIAWSISCIRQARKK